ncbi:hypothetical protein [Hoeflea sp.]|uniref:hypothetical protein n=1 Tax=Hoeflea sp. TaxID=1940281 RepID=UPI003A916977
MSVDMTAVAWYAVICGGLSALAPSFGGRGLRIVVGGVVGIIAARLLPAVRSTIGL